MSTTRKAKDTQPFFCANVTYFCILTHTSHPKLRFFSESDISTNRWRSPHQGGYLHMRIHPSRLKGRTLRFLKACNIMSSEPWPGPGTCSVSYKTVNFLSKSIRSQPGPVWWAGPLGDEHRSTGQGEPWPTVAPPPGPPEWVNEFLAICHKRF